MALRSKIIDLVRLCFLDQPDQVGRVSQIAVMQVEPCVTYVRVLVQMVDTLGVEGRGSTLDAVNLIPLREQKLRQIGAILTGNAGDERAPCHVRHPSLQFLDRKSTRL